MAVSTAVNEGTPLTLFCLIFFISLHIRFYLFSGLFLRLLRRRWSEVTSTAAGLRVVVPSSFFSDERQRQWRQN
ncbi:hypothetical protein Lalb_Chr25g0282261 [Lupinus albus]|uniref:Uncharacterized protein n=1 Tax=Lupinus albus TaxID=3870 RepID=A0A6A4MUB9_LUPAL|nr:hypothetical protein Lalb_Chr25g0282261 [Lupinus albus]